MNGYNWKCVKCGHIWRSENAKCPKCGNATPDQYCEVKCTLCGNVWWNNSTDLTCTCGGCGMPN